MKIKHIYLSVMLITFVQGAGYYLPNQDAFATGKGNAFVATANRASAVHYNPGGLSQISEPTVELGVYSIRLGNESETLSGNARAEEEWQFVPQFYYAQPVNEDITVGLGVTSPFGLGTNWGNSNETGFRTVTNEALLKMIAFTGAVGYRVDDRLSLGAGFSVNYLDAELQQGLGFVDGDFLRFEGDSLALSANFGVLWKPHPKHSLGLTLALQTESTLEGGTTSNLPVPVGDASLNFFTPTRLAFGYSYQVTDRLNVELNVEWLDWDSLDALTLRSPSGETSIPFFWESSFIYEIGLSYELDSGHVISLGYDYNENSQPDAFFNPAIADADRHWFNVGVSREHGQWGWALAYQFGYSNRDVTGSVIGTNGSFESRHHSVSISSSYKF